MINTSTSASNTGTPHPTKAIVEAGYDFVAPKYLAFASRLSTTSIDHYMDQILPHLPAGASILELGCGPGTRCTSGLVERGYKVTGVDISQAQIAYAKQHVPNATFVHADMMSLQFDPESFDAVLAFYSIFHLPQEEQGQMIGKVSGWLKQGGWFLCNFHTQEGDVIRDDWMGATMFSTGRGVEGTSQMIAKEGWELRVVADEIMAEKVGSQDEKFHWIMATKKPSQ